MNINSISAYPENPYSPPISGVFHEQSPRDTTVPGKYAARQAMNKGSAG